MPNQTYLSEVYVQATFKTGIHFRILFQSISDNTSAKAKDVCFKNSDGISNYVRIKNPDLLDNNLDLNVDFIAYMIYLPNSLTSTSFLAIVLETFETNIIKKCFK
jgi:hypothetical protein